MTSSISETSIAERPSSKMLAALAYLLVGVVFGLTAVKSEVVSWFRIQEMFRFQSFFMYGVMGCAVAVGMLSVYIIRRTGVKDAFGEPIVIPPKQWGSGTRYWLGGTIFGCGWVLTGACPGPMFALIGSGATVMILVLVSAVAGTWVYGALRPYLPH